MALVFQRSSLVSPPDPSGYPTWRRLIPISVRFQGQRTAARVAKIHCLSLKESSIYQLLGATHILKLGRAYTDASISASHSLSVNQGALIIKFPRAALVTNALLLSMPLDALAETCEADNSFFNMPLLLAVALIGATVGGLLARQRRGELQRLNEQLRQINAALRRQAKIESYAPTLSYAPVGSRIPEAEVIVDPKKGELISRLKTGKNYLRNLNPEKAFTEFREALELAQSLNDPIKEKKAARGLEIIPSYSTNIHEQSCQKQNTKTRLTKTSCPAKKNTKEQQHVRTRAPPPMVRRAQHPLQVPVYYFSSSQC